MEVENLLAAGRKPNPDGERGHGDYDRRHDERDRERAQAIALANPGEERVAN
jgi:hypothetical protein